MNWWWLVTGAALVGTIANVKRRAWGFALWAATNSLWCGKAVHVGDYPQAVLWATYVVLALWGWFSWKKELKP